MRGAWLGSVLVLASPVLCLGAGAVTVRIETEMGDIDVEVDAARAPVTGANSSGAPAGCPRSSPPYFAPAFRRSRISASSTTSGDGAAAAFLAAKRVAGSTIRK